MPEKNFQDIILRRYSDNSFVEEYSKKALRGLKPYEEKIIERFLQNKQKILSIGCGCGREVFDLSKRGFDVTGIDISEKMIKKANEISKKNKIKAKFYTGDISKINLEKEKYDAVILFNCVINQIPSHKKRKNTIKNVHHSIKKGGLIIIVSNNFYYPGKNLSYYFEHLKDFLSKVIKERRKKIQDKIYEAEGNTVYINLPTPRNLKNLLKNFKITHFTSNRKIKGDKINKSPFFDELLILVGKKY